MQIDDILQELRQERDRITQAIGALSGSGSVDTRTAQPRLKAKRRGRPPGSKNGQAQTAQSSSAGSLVGAKATKKRVLSAEARQRMAEAAKRRWANTKKKVGSK